MPALNEFYDLSLLSHLRGLNTECLQSALPQSLVHNKPSVNGTCGYIGRQHDSARELGHLWVQKPILAPRSCDSGI